MHPLDGPRLKLDIAKRETDDLERIVTAFVNNRDINGVVAEVDPNTGENVLKAVALESPDPEWGIRIGMIAHLLRSALDNVVYQLALMNARWPHQQIAFPIFDDAAEYRKDAAVRIIKGGDNRGKLGGYLRDLKPCHRAFLKSLQPYQRGAFCHTDPLWLLHEMNNADKHRTVHIMLTAVRGPAMVVLEVSDWSGRFNEIMADTQHRLRRSFLSSAFVPFVNGAELMRVPSNVKMEPHVNLTVRFDDRSKAIARRDAFGTMRQIMDRVGSIIETFADDFGSVVPRPLIV